MDDKLKYTPVEGHVILDFDLKKANRKSKLTDYQKCDSAMSILEKVPLAIIDKYFAPKFNQTLIERIDKESYGKIPTSINDDEPPTAA